MATDGGNWKPPCDEDDPGEVDVIATLGQHLFVLEMKSTFMRRSQLEAWLHASSTLRKAGRQLQRKLSAMSQAIGSDLEFRTSLGLTEPPAPQNQHGWIVDTCIECDHQRFSGFLKVSIEVVERYIEVRETSRRTLFIASEENALVTRYSTVTLFARFRGLSTSVPRAQAVW